MQNAILALVLGLAGGAAGAYLVFETRGDAASSAATAAATRADGDLVARVARLEALLPGREEAGASLAGRAEPPTAAGRTTLQTELEEALLERIQPEIEERVAAKWEALQAEAAKEGERAERRGGRRRMPLAEVAAEMGISSAEEADLRQIYKESEEKMLKLLAGEDGDVEQVRRDIDLAVSDEAVRPQMMAKYMPRFLQNVGQVMTIEADKQSRIQQTLGPEKAADLMRYDVIEGRPFGLGGEMRVEARAGR